MIIKREDIQTYKTAKDGINSEIKLHIPTQVFFQSITNGNIHIGFRIAKFKDNTITEEKKFNGIRESSFFKAVQYFESLIEQNQSKSQKQKQEDSEFESCGVFYYIKPNSDKDQSYVLFENKTITIDENDVAKVFSPPQTKKYGRLDMTALEDSKYDIIRGKFALKYSATLTEKEEMKLVTFEDDAVRAYEMMLYSNGEEDNQDESSEPQDVNSNSISKDEIEKETPEQRQPKTQPVKEKQEQEKSQKENQSQKANEESEDEDLGFKDDFDDGIKNAQPEQNSDKKEEKNGENSNSNEDSFKENDDTSKENDDTSKENDDTSKENDYTSKENDDTSKTGDLDTNDNSKEQESISENQNQSKDDQLIGVKPSTASVVDYLNKDVFKSKDYLSSFKTLPKFMRAIKLLDENTLKDISKVLNLPKDSTNQQILNELEVQVTPYFQQQ